MFNQRAASVIIRVSAANQGIKYLLKVNGLFTVNVF